MEEKDAGEVEAAVASPRRRHPMRVLMVLRHNIDAPVPRLDAEVSIGGRYGPGETVVLRMYGRLALHAESVTLPLLAPDAPVVAWWYSETPEVIAYDPLGVFADRRITNVIRDPDPSAALRPARRRLRAGRHRPDLDRDHAVARRAGVGVRHGAHARRRSVAVYGNPLDPSAQLLAGWLSSRLDLDVPVEKAEGKYISSVRSRVRRRPLRRDAQRGLQAGDEPAQPDGLDRAVPVPLRPATCSPRNCAASTPTSPTPRRWVR